MGIGRRSHENDSEAVVFSRISPDPCPGLSRDERLDSLGNPRTHDVYWNGDLVFNGSILDEENDELANARIVLRRNLYWWPKTPGR